MLIPFLQSQSLANFMQTYNKRSFEDIHESLANSDQFRALLLKERLLNFPKGQDFQGVQVKYHLRHEGRRDISNKFKHVSILIITG